MSVRAALALVAAVVVVGCGPPGAPPGPVVGDYETVGDYLAVGRVQSTPVCLAHITIGFVLHGDTSATVASQVTEVHPVAAGDPCAFPMFLLDARVDCVPVGCGGVEVPLPLGQWASTPLAFAVWPNARHLTLTLTAAFGGATQTITDSTAQIVCDPPTIRHRCVFAVPSPN